ncbi:MAG: ABC transporter permease [Treponema sp.]|nr:ABC transporter permease [Treponema sp.]MCL2271454.1 ABC transporter permease [Treponema sp.]
MRVKAIALRILQQMKHDKRTLALMLMAPVLVLSLIYFVLDGNSLEGHVAVINAPENFVNALSEFNIIAAYYDERDARIALERGEVEASIRIINGKSYIEIDGSKPDQARMILNSLETAKMNVNLNRPDLKSEIIYVYGYDDLGAFDNFGSVLIGFLIFFFVFLIAGISFLQERTTGTLEKLLSTPIQRWEIVAGYVMGFGIITLFQSIIISLYVVYVLSVMMIGSIFLVLLITFCTTMMALTLGILLSTAANNEFQMIQFIPLIIVPQVFFSGLFQLSPVWETIGKFMPLYYVAEALRKVMIKGSGFSDIFFDIVVMLALSLLFITVNVHLLKRYRKI